PAWARRILPSGHARGGRRPSGRGDLDHDVAVGQHARLVAGGQADGRQTALHEVWAADRRAGPEGVAVVDRRLVVPGVTREGTTMPDGLHARGVLEHELRGLVDHAW